MGSGIALLGFVVYVGVCLWLIERNHRSEMGKGDERFRV